MKGFFIFFWKKKTGKPLGIQVSLLLTALCPLGWPPDCVRSLCPPWMCLTTCKPKRWATWGEALLDPCSYLLLAILLVCGKTWKKSCGTCLIVQLLKTLDCLRSLLLKMNPECTCSPVIRISVLEGASHAFYERWHPVTLPWGGGLQPGNLLISVWSLRCYSSRREQLLVLCSVR